MNWPAPLDRMKSRNFFLVLLLLIVSTVSLWYMNSQPSQSFRSIVSKTHDGIRNLPSNIKLDKELTVDPLYLKRLGLVSFGQDVKATADQPKPLLNNQPQLPPSSNQLPVIATGARPDLLEETTVLVKSVQKLLPDYRVIIFDLGLSSSEKTKLNKYCNTSWNCDTQAFQFSSYPSHVSYLNIHSYRPVCIQEILKAHGSVIWVDGGNYFIERNLTDTLVKAHKSGIQAWPMKDPTSSLTHLKMFKYFNTEQQAYIFQHAVRSSHLIIYNNDKIMRDVMLPWIKCALLEECINPPGAQNSGCIDFRKPLYKYRGCHKYDMSALNIILGKAFDFNEDMYTASQRLFGSLADDKLRAENRTRPVHEISLGIGHQQIKI